MVTRMNTDDTNKDAVDVLEEEALQDLEKELEEEKGKGEEWRQKYLRALADYHNVTKHAEEEIRTVQQFAGLVFIEKLLPVVDVLRKAQLHCNDKGLDMAMKKMDAYLEDLGVVKLDVFGKHFDPHTMECIEVVPGAEDNKIVEVVEDGYMMQEKLIRPAKVKVGKKEEAVKSKKD